MQRFPEWLNQFPNPSAVNEGSLFLAISVAIIVSYVVDFSHSDSCKMKY